VPTSLTFHSANVSVQQCFTKISQHNYEEEKVLITRGAGSQPPETTETGIFFFLIITAENDIEEDFMNPTLMAPLAIRLRYTPAEVRIFFHSY
jgi:hypothetical protein